MVDAQNKSNTRTPIALLCMSPGKCELWRVMLQWWSVISVAVSKVGRFRTNGPSSTPLASMAGVSNMFTVDYWRCQCLAVGIYYPMKLLSNDTPEERVYD